ncbi:MAG: formylglycine-generating enzyme family protein [Anaerolineae bacterium]
MKKVIAGLGIIILLLLVACGPGGGQPAVVGSPTAATPQKGLVFTPPATREPGEAASIKVKPTDTPLPPPPTPTPLPVEEQPTGGPMVQIPAGPFVMGSDDGDPNESPAQEVDLPAFEIDQFEVTNADFAKFVEATGHVTDAEKQGIGNWRDYAAGKDNHPVVRVTYNDAVAFCQWVGKRLPTEAEWEKAARGDDGRLYPWGNEWDPNKANVKETGLRGTTAVGSFGEGVSPYGAHDMAGNVWEWTSSPFVAYPGSTYQDPFYSPDFRVIRGGAWFEEEPTVHVTSRNAGDPNITANDDVGFRCAK